MLVAALIAVVSTAVVLLNGLSPNDIHRGRANAAVITAAAVSRAGAIEIPLEPTNG